MLPPFELALPPTLGRRLLDAEAMGRIETPGSIDVATWAWQHEEPVWFRTPTDMGTGNLWRPWVRPS